jgi:hypothetical protein
MPSQLAVGGFRVSLSSAPADDMKIAHRFIVGGKRGAGETVREADGWTQLTKRGSYSMPCLWSSSNNSFIKVFF